jgi:RHS repeat-associated protein
MEDATLTAEANEFANVTQTKAQKPGGNTCLQGNNASKTNPTYPMGPWKSFSLTKGDQVSATAIAYYATAPTQNNTVNFNVFVQNWAANSGTNSPEQNAGNSPVLLQGGLSITPNTTNTNPVPVAYLRYIFYDQNGVPLLLGTSAVGSSNCTNNLSLSFTAPQAGTLQVYVANESNTEVWFDEVSITYAPQLIAQENHYDPWGLNLVGIEKNGTPNHRFQFMGVEKESNFNLNWIETNKRGYDPQLGRFHQLDLLGDLIPTISPYAYSFNNPIYFKDPSGLMGTDPHLDLTTDPVILALADANAARASRLTSLPDASDAWYQLQFSSSPTQRAVGSKYAKGDYSGVRQLLNAPRTIKNKPYTSGQSNFQRGFRNVFAKGNIVLGTTIMAVYGTPILVEGAAFSWQGVAIDAGLQSIPNYMFKGKVVSEYDFLDGGLSGFGFKNLFTPQGILRTLAIQTIGAYADVKFFGKEQIAFNDTFDTNMDTGTGSFGAFAGDVVENSRYGQVGATTMNFYLKIFAESLKYKGPEPEEK